jgi:hypothetical protein
MNKNCPLMNYSQHQAIRDLFSRKRKRTIMKKSLLIGMIAFAGIANAQNINFPDANLKNALVNNPGINTDMNTEISVTEALSFNGGLTLANLNISDMTGIEFFQNAQSLNVVNNPITTLDLTGMNGLMILDCFDCDITSLTLPSPGQLQQVYCQNNEINSLDISGNMGLITLNCNDNNLTTLNIASNPGLAVLYCNNNNLINIDLNSSAMLGYIECMNNGLTSVDIANATNLVAAVFNGNNITNFESASNQTIEGLGISGNQLTSLNLAWMPQLTALQCDGNQLTALDASSNTVLTQFVCSNNQLTSLNLANGNNSAIPGADFNATGNAALTCIQVSDPTYCAANWTSIDSGASFDTQCSSAGLAQSIAENVQIFPNPAIDLFVVNTTDKIESITVYDVTGKEVLTSVDPAVHIASLKQWCIYGSCSYKCWRNSKTT